MTPLEAAITLIAGVLVGLSPDIHSEIVEWRERRERRRAEALLDAHAVDARKGGPFR